MVSMSMNAMARSKEQNPQPMIKFDNESEAINTITNKVAVKSSTIKYLAGILCPQQRALPLKSNHDNRGMFNHQGIGAPHLHRERGNRTDFPEGILYMQTFKKLPMHAPMIKIKIESISLTQHFIGDI
jgi:hypothetical protein